MPNMKEKIYPGALWNNGAKYGALLGLATVACRFAAVSISRIGPTALTAFLSFIVWVIQFTGCILLMRFSMKKITEKYDGTDNRTTFRYGVILALLSSIICSAYALADTMFFAPDMAEKEIDALYQLYGPVLDSNMRSILDKFTASYPQIKFFSTLIYCFVYGVVLSSILSSKIPPKDPFAGYRKDSEQIENSSEDERP